MYIAIVNNLYIQYISALLTLLLRDSTPVCMYIFFCFACVNGRVYVCTFVYKCAKLVYKYDEKSCKVGISITCYLRNDYILSTNFCYSCNCYSSVVILVKSYIT